MYCPIFSDGDRMLHHLRVLPFLFGIVVGVITVIVAKPQKVVVYKYPNPSTAKTTIYKDGNGMCYRYQANAVNCDANEDKLKEFPLNK
jgi:hypothetical protein